MKTNFIIPANQISGAFVSADESKKLANSINTVNAYHFEWLREYVDATRLDPEQIHRMFGTPVNLTLNHHFVNYFGVKAVPCSVDLLSEKAKQKARRYYCHIKNYEHMELDGNVFSGKSVPRGPAMCYLVKFMEEIIGFKALPGDLVSVDNDGKPLPKAFFKSGPPVGFDNNFQPEAYAAAENKIAYMRNLTVVQKIIALQWMALGEHAFREDINALYTARERKKILKKERKAMLKREKLILKRGALTDEDKIFYDEVFNSRIPQWPPSFGRAADPILRLKKTSQYERNSVAQRDFNRLPLAERITVLYEMVGGSTCGRANRKLSTRKLTSRADFLAASLSQQTLYLYRKLNQQDEDENRSFLKKHLGTFYTRNGTAVSSLSTISRGRVTDQTRFLANFVGKLEKVVNKNTRAIARLKSQVRQIRMKGMLEGVKNIGTSVGTIMTSLGGTVGINLFDPSEWIGAAGGSAGLAGMAMATFSLIGMSAALEKVNSFTDVAEDHFVKLNEWLTTKLIPRIEFMEKNQDSLMEFRNKIEVMIVILQRWFEQNEGSPGSPADTSGLRLELEGAYNYLRELIDNHKVELVAAIKCISARVDGLDQRFEEELESFNETKARLQQRIDDQERQIQSLTARVQELEQTDNPHVQIIKNICQRLETLENEKVKQEQINADLQQRLEELEENRTAETINHLETVIAELRGQINDNSTAIISTTTALQGVTIRVDGMNNVLQAIRSDVDRLKQQSLTDFNGRLNALDNTVSSLRSSLWDAVNKLNRLEQSSSQFENSIRLNRDSITFLNELTSKMSRICRTVKLQYIVKDWVPNQTTDGNGFMRLSMSSFPNDIISKTNDYIISIVPYDVYVSTYDRVFIAWCDYRTNNDNDREINLAIRYAYDSGIGRVGSGQRIKIWYWANNPADEYSL